MIVSPLLAKNGSIYSCVTNSIRFIYIYIMLNILSLDRLINYYYPATDFLFKGTSFQALLLFLSLLLLDHDIK